MKLFIIFFTLIFVSFSFSNTSNILFLICSNPKGIDLHLDLKTKKEKFSQGQYSNTNLSILYLDRSLGFSWHQNTNTSIDKINSSNFKSLEVASINNNMIVGYSKTGVKGIEGIRVHLKNKTAIYFKHVLPSIDGLGTDGIYTMNCVDHTQTFINEMNKKSS